MRAYLQPSLLLLLAALLSAALTPAMRYIAAQVGVVARPSNDRWGRREVPLLGGVAIYLGCVLAVLLLAAPSTHTGWALAAASAMMFVGLVDDFVHMRPSTKLMAQLLVACAVLFGDIDQRWLGWPGADAVISIFWIVAITNAFNLLDNMDGLCAGIAAIAAVAFAVSVAPAQPALAQVAGALAGAACGFLLFNFHPASVFMGDAGSLFIGSLLAVLSLSTDHGDSVGVLSSLAFPVLLLLIPLFDTLFVTLSRKLSARKASAGGRDHTSHRLVAMGLPEPRAVVLLYAFAALGGLTAVALRSSVEEATLLTSVLLVGLTLLGVRLARVNVYGNDDFIALRDKRYTPLLVDFAYKRRVFEVLLDVILASIAYYAAYLVRFGDLFAVYYQGLFLESLPLVIGCELVGLYAAGVYRGIWQHVSLPDVAAHVKGVAIGTVASVLVLLYFNRFEGYSRGVFIINFLILGALVTGSRLSFRVMRELTQAASRRGTQPALVYGAGDRAASALRTLRENQNGAYRPVGLLDDDRARVGRVIAGVPVLGVVGDTAAILQRTKAAAVVVSTPVDAQQLAVIERACAAAGAAVLLLEVRLTPLFAPASSTGVADRGA